MFYTPAFTTLNENAHIQVGERKKRTLRLPETHDTNNTICSQRYVTQQGIKKIKMGGIPLETEAQETHSVVPTCMLMHTLAWLHTS